MHQSPESQSSKVHCQALLSSAASAGTVAPAAQSFLSDVAMAYLSLLCSSSQSALYI